VRSQLPAAERAVEADEQRLRMADRVPERLGRLSRQQPSDASVIVPGSRAQREPALVEQREAA